MLKIGAVVNLILAVSESFLSCRWFCQAKRNDWEPKRVFYGVVWFLNALMQCMMATQLWTAAEEEKNAAWDDFEDYED